MALLFLFGLDATLFLRRQPGIRLQRRQKAFIALVSIAIGAASYRYVEQPFRTRGELWTLPRVTAGSVAIFLSLFVFTCGAFLTEGFPSRLPTYLLPAELARRTGTPRDECFRNSNSIKRAAEVYCGFGGDAATVSVILWGDSFANQYLEPISAAAQASGIHGLIATQSACRAFVEDVEKHSGDQQPCRQFNRDTLDFVTGHNQPGIILLASNWTSGADVRELVDRMLSSGKTVILIMPLLSIPFDLPQRWIEEQLRAGRAITDWKVEADPVLVQRRLRDEIRSALRAHENDPRLITVDPQSVTCESDYCYLVRNGQANFRDAAHISNVNAMQYRGIFEAAFSSALRADPQPE